MTKTTDLGDKPKSFRGDFLMLAINMSWQLALAVLIPILGGYALDHVFNTSPILFILGFVLALLGMTAVLWTNAQKGNRIGADYAAHTPKPKYVDEEDDD